MLDAGAETTVSERRQQKHCCVRTIDQPGEKHVILQELFKGGHTISTVYFLEDTHSSPVSIISSHSFITKEAGDKRTFSQVDTNFLTKCK